MGGIGLRVGMKSLGMRVSRNQWHFLRRPEDTGIHQ